MMVADVVASDSIATNNPFNSVTEATGMTSTPPKLSSSGINSVRLVTGEFPPYTGESLKYGGEVTEMVRRIFELEGIAASVNFAPWKRGYAETLSGNYAGTFPYSFSEERAQTFLFSDPIRSEPVYLFVHEDAEIKFTKPDDLKGIRFCIALGYNVFPPIRKLIDHGIATLTTVNEIGSCFRMITGHRVDATFLNLDVGRQLAEQNSPSNTATTAVNATTGVQASTAQSPAIGSDLMTSAVDDKAGQPVMEGQESSTPGSTIQAGETPEIEDGGISKATEWATAKKVGAGFKYLETPIFWVDEYLIVAKGQPGAEAILDAFNAGLVKLKKSGLYRKSLNAKDAVLEGAETEVNVTITE